MFKLLFGGSKRESAEALKTKGNAAMQAGALAEAANLYRQAIDADSNYMPAYYNLGNVLRLQHSYVEALRAYQRAGELAPDDYEIFVNMGVTLNAMTRFDEAIDAFNAAARLAPGALEAQINKGIALSRAGRQKEAISVYGQVLEADPGSSLARYYRSMEFLLLERWHEGFLEHESRLSLPGAVPDDLLAGKPKWDGSNLDGKTLLIYPEQGMGDMIQFLRYASLCKDRGGRIMVVCHPPLARLLRTVAVFDVVVPDGDALPEPFDAYISVMSLPSIFGRLPQLLPLGIDVPIEKSPVFDGVKGLKVGVCWSGSPGHGRDSERSISKEKFWERMSGADNVSFFSIQIGDGSQEFSTPLSPLISDFLDTAVLVKQLDLVITVDTSLAHLCGTLGIPTWTLVTFSPDWRWGMQSEWSPWYPSMRIFRQPSPADWDTPLSEVRQCMAKVAGKR